MQRQMAYVTKDVTNSAAQQDKHSLRAKSLSESIELTNNH